MGDTYDRVQTSARVVDLKEQANLIYEVESLFYWARNDGEDDKRYYLMCFDEELSEGSDESGMWEGKVKGLQRSMNKIEAKIQEISG